MTTTDLPRYIVMTSSVPARGKARRGTYKKVVVVELDGSGIEEPKMISERARGVARIVRQYGACSVGRTDRCQYSRALDAAGALADHLKFLHRHRRCRPGSARFRAALRQRIAGEENAELQRELIDLYGGMEAWLADVGGEEVHADEAGALVRIATAAGPVMAVRVTCPSTRREYVLRVPPAITTAREGVAWTFGVTAEEYQPAAQS